MIPGTLEHQLWMSFVTQASFFWELSVSSTAECRFRLLMREVSSRSICRPSWIRVFPPDGEVNEIGGIAEVEEQGSEGDRLQKAECLRRDPMVERTSWQERQVRREGLLKLQLLLWSLSFFFVVKVFRQDWPWRTLLQVVMVVFSRKIKNSWIVVVFFSQNKELMEILRL